MRKQLLVIFLVFLVSTGYSRSQQDKEEVVQQCAELLELHTSLVKEDGSKLTQLAIKLCSSSDTQGKIGELVWFVAKVEYSALQRNSYADFIVFEVENRKTRMDFIFFSNMEKAKFLSYEVLEPDLNNKTKKVKEDKL